MKQLLVRLFGFPALLIHSDTLVTDRWRWLTRNLPAPVNGATNVLDVGCGNGAFTIGMARRGFQSLGLSWDEGNKVASQHRASVCNAPSAQFEIMDVRHLDQRVDLSEKCDVVVCLETIEHILNDQKLMIDMARCLKPGGTLLLTTPNSNYKPMTQSDKGPFRQIEDGWHVRKGYTPDDLKRLCAGSGLKVCDIGYCSDFVSQKVTALWRVASRINPFFGWGVVLPFRVLPFLLDPWFSRLIRWPGFSITLVAAKS